MLKVYANWSDITMKMKEKIIEELNKIEKVENVKIIYAVESGSRAWGFAGTDSDYDVRFIYVRNEDFYLKLEDTRDVLEYPINDLLDISGWDISKTLKLAHSSNPSLYEWFQSPIVYKEDNIVNELRELFEEYFSVNKISRHYYHMAKNQYNNYIKNKEEVNVKKYFYLLRAILSAKYVLDNKNAPPIEFDKLRKILVPENIDRIIDGMLKIKKNSEEMQVIQKNEKLDKYIKGIFSEVKSNIDALPKESKKSWELLNKKFRKIIKEC